MMQFHLVPDGLANFRYFEALAAAGLYYLALTTLFMFVQGRVERALDRREPIAPTMAQTSH